MYKRQPYDTGYARLLDEFLAALLLETEWIRLGWDLEELPIDKVTTRYYWKGIYKDTEEWVSTHVKLHSCPLVR